MSILNEHQKTPDRIIVICWRCDAPMRIKTITPAMTSAPLDEIVYRCPACATERKQIVSRDD
jgi:Zn finger protein HypA/HybF involved in hydrogenase expression